MLSSETKEGLLYIAAFGFFMTLVINGAQFLGNRAIDHNEELARQLLRENGVQVAELTGHGKRHKEHAWVADYDLFFFTVSDGVTVQDVTVRCERPIPVPDAERCDYI